mgnify:CR=1 FL=1
MQILYPLDPLTPDAADGPYQTEYLAAIAADIPCSLFDFDALSTEEFRPEFRPRPALKDSEPTLYRGWMLTPQRYQLLEKMVCQQGSQPITSLAHYTQCHYLPGWYTRCRQWTAETHVFPADADIVTAAVALNWPAYFVKDYVKSNTGDKGSIAYSPAEISDILAQITLYRGEIEGGIVLRQVEHYLPDTECRYFVVNGQAYGPDGSVPELVNQIAKTITAPFYSVDVVTNTEGDLRLVEIGDGQVSSRKNGSIDWFITVLCGLMRS